MWALYSFPLFSLLNFISGNLELTRFKLFNMNIWLLCFGAPGVWQGVLARTHVLALSSDFRDYIEQVCLNKLSKVLEKHRPATPKTFPTLILQNELWQFSESVFLPLIFLFLTAVLGMSLRKVTLLGSNSASVTDLKRIQTPHSLYCDFGGYKGFTTCWSGGKVQVWVQVWAPACHLAISPKAVREDNRRFRGQNHTAKLLGPISGFACSGQTGEHKHRVFPSLRQSLLAATSSLEENMLPLLQDWLSSRVNKVLMLF